MSRDDDLREALGMVTAWVLDGPAGSAEALRLVLDERGEDGLPHLVSGLTNLCVLLLALREADTGIPPRETLLWLATHPWNAGPGV